MNAGFIYHTAVGRLSGDDVLAFTEGEEEEHSEGEEAEGDEETVNPVLPTANDIFWAALFFFALWAALRYVLLPPVQKVRAERAEKIAAARDAADNASADMGTAQADYDAALADARTEAAQILDEARLESEANRSQLVGAAEAEAAELRASAEAEVSVARANALETLTDDVAEVAAGAASSVLGRSVDAGAARSIAQRTLQGGDQ